MVSTTRTGSARLSIAEDLKVIVNGVDYTSSVMSYKIIERLNQVPILEDSSFIDVDDSNTDFLPGKSFCVADLRTGNYVSQKFMLSRPSDETNNFFGVKGAGWAEMKLKDFLVVKTASSDSSSQAGRPQYNSKYADTQLVDEQLAAYTTGVSKGTVLHAYLNIRSEGDTLISFFSGIADVLGTEWYSSYSSNLVTSYINITPRGTDKSSTIILDSSGANQNCYANERKVEYGLLKNDLTIYGYGDGINQIESHNFYATSSRTKLSADLTAVATSCTVVDGSVLPASGNVWVGCEKVAYASKTSNTLNSLTRGVAFQGNVSVAYVHSINSPVYDAQYTIAVPQSSGSGSSINSNGQKMEHITMADVIDQSTLDILSEKLLLERKGSGSTYAAPESILVYPEEYVWAMNNIGVGDQITITDSEAGLSGVYRIFGRTLIYDNGSYEVELEVSNTTQNMLAKIKDDAEEAVNLSKYMQGATNIFSVNETNNTDGTQEDQSNTGSMTSANPLGDDIWKEGFETGSFNSEVNWTTSGTTSVQNTVKHSGTYAAKIEANGYAEYSFSTQQGIDARGMYYWSFWLYTTANSKGGYVAVYIPESSQNNAFICNLYGDSMSFYVGRGSNYPYYQSKTSGVSINTWYKFVVEMDWDTSLGRCYVYDASNNLIWTTDACTIADLVSYSGFTKIRLKSDSSGVIYFDDIAIGRDIVASTGYILQAQTFKSGVSGIISKVELGLYKDTVFIGKKLLVEIQATTTGVPNGTVLSSGYLLTSDLATTATLEKIPVSNIFLIAGTTYAIVLSSDWIGHGSIQVPITASSTYADGSYFTKNATIVSWTDQSIDLYFKTYIATQDGAITLFFEIPVDAVALNSVKIAYRNETPQLWQDSGGILDLALYSYTTTLINILTTDDASTGSPVWVDRTVDLTSIYGTLSASNGSTEVSVSLTNYYSGVGWKGVMFVTDGVSRHKVQATIKCYVQSKTV